MLLYLSFVFLPIIIVFVMSQLFGKALLKEGKRSKIITFGVICVLVYGFSLAVIAQTSS